MALCVSRMQVEVSKYTEGLSEKRMRPNELPVSLIRYDGEPLPPMLLNLLDGFPFLPLTSNN
jgi:hypothetical protein